MDTDVDYGVGFLVAFPAIYIPFNWPSSRSETLFVVLANRPVLPITMPSSDQL